jgi:hypothetical protein
MLGVIICSTFLMFQNKLSRNNLFCKNNNIFGGDDLYEKYKTNSGLCEVVKNDDPEELDRIIEHFRKHELLKKLNSSLISMHEKIYIIKQNDILDIDNCETNITNGGLLEDWDFNF